MGGALSGVVGMLDWAGANGWDPSGSVDGRRVSGPGRGSMFGTGAGFGTSMSSSASSRERMEGARLARPGGFGGKAEGRVSAGFGGGESVSASAFSFEGR